MTLPPPFLGADPLRPPPSTEELADDPILAGYGPPEPTPEGEAAGIPVDPAAVTAGLVMAFDVLAQLRGEHWHAEPAEFAMAAPPISRYLNTPDTSIAEWLQAHGDKLLIVVGLGAVVVPRAMIEYQVLRARRAALEERTATYHEEPTDGYPYRALTPQPGAGAGADAGRPAGGAPAGDAGGDLFEGREGGGPAVGVETDARALAASVGGILG